MGDFSFLYCSWIKVWAKKWDPREFRYNTEETPPKRPHIKTEDKHPFKEEIHVLGLNLIKKMGGHVQ